MECEALCRVLDSLLSIDDSVRGLGVFVAYSVAWGDGVSGVDVFESIVERVVGEVRSRYSLEELRRDPVVRAYRDFYWRIGVDPTKTRPSSEALVRRVLRGRFPRISPLVDAGNLASIETLVPIGLYDVRFFRPPVKIVLSRGGEVFEPIGGSVERLKPGIPVMVDSSGLIMHVYPHRDSRATAIRSDTRCMLVVGAGVPGVGEARVRRAVERVLELVGLLGWRSCGRVVVSV